ncbi:MAG: MAPEG family protein [Spirochaetes bacterium]|nr:MAPEG family protein [Spirochaetota bacterium]
MNPALIFLPVLAQVILTLVVFVAMTVAKSRAMKRGEVDLERRALHKDAWPDYVLKLSNNIANQFETPVLFYAVSFVLWALRAVDAVTLSLASAYVVTRIVHAFVHTGSNYVPVRKRVFTLGVVIILAMTVFAAIAVISDL